jgi:hypothetical protein
MKALSMLDHVMLWFARIFAVWLLFEAFAWLRWTNLHHWPIVWPLGLRALAIDSRIWSPIMICLTLAWLLSLWRMDKKSTRVFMCFSVSPFVAANAFRFARPLFDLPQINPSYIPTMLIDDFIVMGIPLLGYLTMIWLSLHSPQAPRSPGHNPVSTSPLPQSC